MRIPGVSFEDGNIIGGSVVMSWGVWATLPAELKTGLVITTAQFLITLMGYIGFRIRMKHEIEKAREIERARAEERIAVYKSFGYRVPQTAEFTPVDPNQKETVPLRKELP
jgi:hypothetical protein